MRKKYALILTALMCGALAAGCSGKTGKPSDTAVQQEEIQGNLDNEMQSVPESAQTEPDASLGEEKTLVGTIEEIKDFMFIVTDENGTSYVIDFETEPEGLANTAAGDKVKVTYTGELSEIDAFTGTIISVEKQ